MVTGMSWLQLLLTVILNCACTSNLNATGGLYNIETGTEGSALEYSAPVNAERGLNSTATVNMNAISELYGVQNTTLWPNMQQVGSPFLQHVPGTSQSGLHTLLLQNQLGVGSGRNTNSDLVGYPLFHPYCPSSSVSLAQPALNNIFQPLYVDVNLANEFAEYDIQAKVFARTGVEGREPLLSVCSQLVTPLRHSMANLLKRSAFDSEIDDAPGPSTKMAADAQGNASRTGASVQNVALQYYNEMILEIKKNTSKQQATVDKNIVDAINKKLMQLGISGDDTEGVVKLLNDHSAATQQFLSRSMVTELQYLSKRLSYEYTSSVQLNRPDVVSSIVVLTDAIRGWSIDREMDESTTCYASDPLDFLLLMFFSDTQHIYHDMFIQNLKPAVIASLDPIWVLGIIDFLFTDRFSTHARSISLGCNRSAMTTSLLDHIFSGLFFSKNSTRLEKRHVLGLLELSRLKKSVDLFCHILNSSETICPLSLEEANEVFIPTLLALSTEHNFGAICDIIRAEVYLNACMGPSACNVMKGFYRQLAGRPAVSQPSADATKIRTTRIKTLVSDLLASLTLEPYDSKWAKNRISALFRLLSSRPFNRLRIANRIVDFAYQYCAADRYVDILEAIRDYFSKMKVSDAKPKKLAHLDNRQDLTTTKCLYSIYRLVLAVRPWQLQDYGNLVSEIDVQFLCTFLHFGMALEAQRLVRDLIRRRSALGIYSAVASCSRLTKEAVDQCLKQLWYMILRESGPVILGQEIRVCQEYDSTSGFVHKLATLKITKSFLWPYECIDSAGKLCGLSGILIDLVNVMGLIYPLFLPNIYTDGAFCTDYILELYACWCTSPSLPELNNMIDDACWGLCYSKNEQSLSIGQFATSIKECLRKIDANIDSPPRLANMLLYMDNRISRHIEYYEAMDIFRNCSSAIADAETTAALEQR